MQVHIDSSGVLHIYPVNSTEEFALQNWAARQNAQYQIHTGTVTYSPITGESIGAKPAPAVIGYHKSKVE